MMHIRVSRLQWDNNFNVIYILGTESIIIHMPLWHIYDNIFRALEVNLCTGIMHMFTLYHEASIIDLSTSLPNIGQQSPGRNLVCERASKMEDGNCGM